MTINRALPREMRCARASRGGLQPLAHACGESGEARTMATTPARIAKRDEDDDQGMPMIVTINAMHADDQTGN